MRDSRIITAGVSSAVISSLILAAHFLRGGNFALLYVTVLVPLILVIKRKWAVIIVFIFLAAGGMLWLHTAFGLVMLRIENAMPWLRLSLIVVSVSLFAFIAAVLVLRMSAAGYYSSAEQTCAQSVAAFIISSAVMSAAELKTSFQILMLDRLISGAAWIQVILLGAYVAWITEKFILSRDSGRLRTREWLLFSIVFFLQLILGLAGIEKFLLTGKLHLPVPAVMIGGPVYRGTGFFMPLLFVSSIAAISVISERGTVWLQAD